MVNDFSMPVGSFAQIEDIDLKVSVINTSHIVVIAQADDRWQVRMVDGTCLELSDAVAHNFMARLAGMPVANSVARRNGLEMTGSVMIDKQLSHAIKSATVELSCGDEPLKVRLARAIRILDTFLGRREEWPPSLYRRLQDISDELRSTAPIEGVLEGMEMPKVARLAERILHLYADCQMPSERSENRSDR